MITQYRPKRKPSGARYIASRGKKKSEMGHLPTHTKIGERKVKLVKVRGRKSKNKTLFANTVNLFDPKTKKYAPAKIVTVAGNPANRHFVIRNIITKGTIVKTDKGNARVTNRPGQEAAINAVLIQE